MPTEHGRMPGHEPLTALYMGVVIDNADPEKVGRVRVRIPGLTSDEGSAWAHPLGWPGAGSPQYGMFAPPQKGAEVGVLFSQGDIDHPHYLCGHPGRGEAPSETTGGTAPADAGKIMVIESLRWRVTLDDRPGNEQLQLKDKLTGDVVEIDGVKAGVHIKGTSTVFIEAAGLVKLDGAMIQLGDRVVVPNGSPIN
jgi:hypothetical protein